MTDAASGPDLDLSPRDAGRSALLTLERALDGRPNTDGLSLSQATLRLCEYRESLIEQAQPGTPEARQRLGRLNAVLSVVAAVHFPLGPVPWEALADARDWLADLLAD